MVKPSNHNPNRLIRGDIESHSSLPVTVGDQGSTVRSEKQEESDEADKDLNNSLAPVKALTPGVKEFMETAFSKCIPRAKRRRLASDYPRPDITVTKVPRMDTIFRSVFGKNTTDRSDEQLAKFQAAVLAACAPLANLWSHMDDQGLRGRPGETIPTEEVLRVAKDTLALLGNANRYISQVRRAQFISSVNAQCPAVAKFLRNITREGTCGKGSELFGPDVHKLVTDRADTIEAFNKVVSKVESASKTAPTGRARFLYKRPTAHGSRSGCDYIPYRAVSNRQDPTSEAVPKWKERCEYFEQYTVIYAALSRHGIRDFTRIFRSDVKSEFH